MQEYSWPQVYGTQVVFMQNKKQGGFDRLSVHIHEKAETCEDPAVTQVDNLDECIDYIVSLQRDVERHSGLWKSKDVTHIVSWLP